MCFDLDSRPPIAPIAGAAVDGSRLVLRSADGGEFAAFSARASAPTGAAMLVLPDVRGLHPFYEELALRFAESGIEALAIDYFGRTAGTGARAADFEYMPHVDQIRWPSLQQDIRAGRDALAATPGVTAVFALGFCFGGRLAFLSGALPAMELSGVIGFYGIVVGPGRAGIPAPIDFARELRCPVLGLFGGADSAIPPETVNQYDRALAEAGVEHELITYPGAPHSFFDRKAADFAAESEDAWRRIAELVRRHTPAE